jgi:hypothetical protein
MKFTFICEHDADLFGPKTTNTHVIDGEQTVHQLLERFEDFLKGCGYVIDGHFDVVELFDEECGYDFKPLKMDLDSINLNDYYADVNISSSVTDDIIKTQDY